MIINFQEAQTAPLSPNDLNATLVDIREKISRIKAERALVERLRLREQAEIKPPCVCIDASSIYHVTIAAD